MTVDLDRLLRLRLAVARFGEMDIARWWNTKGQLGRVGTMALRRGFPRTHHFAQARAVFAVAAHRCEEWFNPPNCATLWRLPPDLEESFDTRWEHWLDQTGDWDEFFQRIEKPEADDLLAFLRALGLLSDADATAAARLKRSAEGRAVPLPGVFAADDATIMLLAAGFARGEPGTLAVPYARVEA